MQRLEILLTFRWMEEKVGSVSAFSTEPSVRHVLKFNEANTSKLNILSTLHLSKLNILSTLHLYVTENFLLKIHGLFGAILTLCTFVDGAFLTLCTFEDGAFLTLCTFEDIRPDIVIFIR